MATLPLVNGGSLSWSPSRLAEILAALRLANQARATVDDLVFMNAGFGLLVVDPSWNVGLRVSEQFEVRPAPSF